MSDDTTNPTPPEAAPETFTREDIDKILAADRAERTAAAPPDPIARYRASVGAAKPIPSPSSDMTELVGLMKAQLAHSITMNMPKPAPPPKALNYAEKLASTNPDTWLAGKDSSWTAADREALVREEMDKLASSGFRGDREQEASRRAGARVADAANRSLRNVRVDPLTFGKLAERIVGLK